MESNGWEGKITLDEKNNTTWNAAIQKRTTQHVNYISCKVVLWRNETFGLHPSSHNYTRIKTVQKWVLFLAEYGTSSTEGPRNTVCFLHILVNTLHKGK